MQSEITKQIEDGYHFTIALPPGWDRAKDRAYYQEWCGAGLGLEHALETVMDAHATLETTVRTAIGFLRGGISPDVLEVVDLLSFEQRIRLLRTLVHRFPPFSQMLRRFEQDFYNCLTVELLKSRILLADLADRANGCWLYELQQLPDYLLSVNHELEESMGAEYEQYEEYVRSLPSC